MRVSGRCGSAAQLSKSQQRGCLNQDQATTLASRRGWNSRKRDKQLESKKGGNSGEKTGEDGGGGYIDWEVVLQHWNRVSLGV